MKQKTKQDKGHKRDREGGPAKPDSENVRSEQSERTNIRSEQGERVKQIEINIISYPIVTEKSINLMQKENKLIFVTSPSANKNEIRQEVQSLFKVKVLSVNTMMLPNCKKKAVVKLAPENPAIDIVTQLGLM
ncbi:50S ribosomal protein L23 [archaeon]|nr:50S ribosomal protein L23 [archaeon]